MKKLLTILSLASLATMQHAAAQATPFTLNNANYTQNFDAIVTSQTASIATAAPGWSIWKSNTSAIQPNYSLSGNNTTAVTQNAGTSGTGVISSASAGGAYLWVSGVLASGTDKSIGFLTTGSYPGTTSTAPGQSLALFFGFTNTLGNTIDTLALSWNYERYREGSRAQGWEFYSSSDGVNWDAHTSGNQAYTGTTISTVYNPPQSIAKSVTLSNLNIADGQNYYLRWSFVSTASWSNSQGLGLDDISMQVVVVPEPSTGVLGGLGILIVSLLRRRKTYCSL